MAPAILVTTALDWFIHQGDFWRVWSIWYVSNTLGMLVIAPLIVALVDEFGDRVACPSVARLLEGAVLAAGLLISTHLVFSAAPSGLSATPMAIPSIFLIWAAIRFALPARRCAPR
jgi:integral membrane sensor domain MASE1